MFILRQFATFTGLLDVTETPTGVRGMMVQDGVTVCMELVVVPSSGAIELLQLTGADAGMSGNVSSLAELREGVASGALEALAS